LHTHRDKINKERLVNKESSKHEESQQICPFCQAKTLIYGICINCKKISIASKNKQPIKKTDIKCPTCNSINYEKKGFRNQKQRYICKVCGKNWTSNLVANDNISKKLKTKDYIQRENTLKEIVAYLKNQEIKKQPLIFWYRDDNKPRKIYDYFVDKKYVNVRSDKGYYIKFLIDKIRKI
jgi:DNA-directed RNA polymerase subunit RPC12/RpoP